MSNCLFFLQHVLIAPGPHPFNPREVGILKARFTDVAMATGQDKRIQLDSRHQAAKLTLVCIQQNVLQEPDAWVAPTSRR